MSINVGTAIAYLDLDTSRFTSAVSGARSALNDLVNSTDPLSSRIQTLGSSVTNLGGQLSKSLTFPIVGLGTAAVATASSFEESMSKVEAISGATAKEMEILHQKAIEMGASTKFSAKESADAFTYMAMAGWDASQMVSGISGIMSLAAADGLDLATTSDIVTDALTAFGLKAEDSAHFADVLAQASSSANTNVSLLGESFKYVAPVAGSLGMSVEDTALALGLMANAGIKGSQSGTSLRASLTNLVKPTDAMAKKMVELGIEVENSDGTMKSLREIMEILRDSFDRLSESEQANAASTLFGKEAMSGMLAIINTSEEDFYKLANAIEHSSGRADAMAETMMNNLPGAIEQLKGAIETLLIRLGEALVPTIREITEFITKIIEKLNEMTDEEIEQIVQIGSIIAAVGPLLMIIGNVITFIGKVAGAISTIISVGSTLIGGISSLIGWIGSVVSSIGSTLIPALSSINPVVGIIIAVIAALIAIGVALVKNWDEVKAWGEKTWKAILENIQSVVDAIGESLSSLAKWVSETVESISEWMTDLFESISGFFTNLFENIGGWFSKTIDSITGFFSKLLEGVTSSIGTILEKITSWGASMVEKAGEIGSNFVQKFLGFFDGFVGKISNLISGVVGEITTWGANLLSKAREIGGGFYDAIAGSVQDVTSFFTSMFDRVIEAVTSFGPKLFDAGKNLFNSLWEGIKSVFTSITSWVSSKLQPLVDTVNNILSPIKNLTQKVSSVFSGSHANGLDYVPYDGYVAQLHKGERVLTKQENKSYSGGNSPGGGDTFNFYSPEPIDEYEAARLMKQTKKEMDMDI